MPSSSFTPDITPIILAAHRDNYEIIKILLDRGYRIPKPHDVRCNCKYCVTQSEEDSLRHSRSRINAYRALASPSLIALSSKDPILTSFELSWELKRLSKLENEFKLDYEKLAKKCQEFAVDLLEQTRGSKELEIILNHDSACPGNEQDFPKNESKMKLSRLKLAIKYKQKKVCISFLGLVSSATLCLRFADGLTILALPDKNKTDPLRAVSSYSGSGYSSLISDP